MFNIITCKLGKFQKFSKYREMIKKQMIKKQMF